MRTDRSLSFYDGDDNPHVYLMRDILLTYSFYNFDLGYCQVVNFCCHDYCNFYVNILTICCAVIYLPLLWNTLFFAFRVWVIFSRQSCTWWEMNLSPFGALFSLWSVLDLISIEIKVGCTLNFLHYRRFPPPRLCCFYLCALDLS